MEDGRPWNGHWTFDEVASMLREQTPDDQAASARRVRRDDPRRRRAGRCYSLVDNTDKAYVFPMVDPPARRQRRGRRTGGGAGRPLSWARPHDGDVQRRLRRPEERDDAAPVRFAARARLPRREHRDPPAAPPPGRRGAARRGRGGGAAAPATATRSRRSSTASPTSCSRRTAPCSTSSSSTPRAGRSTTRSRR